MYVMSVNLPFCSVSPYRHWVFRLLFLKYNIKIPAQKPTQTTTTTIRENFFNTHTIQQFAKPLPFDHQQQQPTYMKQPDVYS